MDNENEDPKPSPMSEINKRADKIIREVVPGLLALVELHSEYRRESSRSELWFAVHTQAGPLAPPTDDPGWSAKRITVTYGAAYVVWARSGKPRDATPGSPSDGKH